MRAETRRPRPKWLSRPSESQRRLGFGIFLLAAFATLPSAVRAAPPETERAFIERVYRPYFVDPMAAQPDIAWFDRGILSRAFLRLVRADNKLAGGEEGYIDADPICACQDWGQFSYTILRIRKMAQRRFVTVRLRNWDNVHLMTLVLVPNGRRGFVIDDLMDDVYRPSFKLWMADALRNGQRAVEQADRQ